MFSSLLCVKNVPDFGKSLQQKLKNKYNKINMSCTGKSNLKLCI